MHDNDIISHLLLQDYPVMTAHSYDAALRQLARNAKTLYVPVFNALSEVATTATEECTAALLRLHVLNSKTHLPQRVSTHFSLGCIAEACLHESWSYVMFLKVIQDMYFSLRKVLVINGGKHIWNSIRYFPAHPLLQPLALPQAWSSCSSRSISVLCLFSPPPVRL